MFGTLFGSNLLGSVVMGGLAPLGLGADALGLNPIIVAAMWLTALVALLLLRVRMGAATSAPIAVEPGSGSHTAERYDAEGTCPGCRALQASPGWQAYLRVRQRVEASPA